MLLNGEEEGDLHAEDPLLPRAPSSPSLFTVETRLPHFVGVVSNKRPYEVSAFGGWFEGFLF